MNSTWQVLQLLILLFNIQSRLNSIFIWLISYESYHMTHTCWPNDISLCWKTWKSSQAFEIWNCWKYKYKVWVPYSKSDFGPNRIDLSCSFYLSSSDQRTRWSSYWPTDQSSSQLPESNDKWQWFWIFIGDWWYKNFIYWCTIKSWDPRTAEKIF